MREVNILRYFRSTHDPAASRTENPGVGGSIPSLPTSIYTTPRRARCRNGATPDGPRAVSAVSVFPYWGTVQLVAFLSCWSGVGAIKKFNVWQSAIVAGAAVLLVLVARR